MELDHWKLLYAKLNLKEMKIIKKKYVRPFSMLDHLALWKTQACNFFNPIEI